MKSFIIFILLGVVAFLISMAVLSNSLTSQIALYTSALAYLVIISIYFLPVGIQDKFQLASAGVGTHEHRRTPRYHVDHYPGEVTIPDGTKMKVLLNNISSGGFLVLCTELAEYQLAQKISNLKKNKDSEIELSLHIPLQERVYKITANCKVTHISQCKKEVFPVAAGLQVTEYKDSSDDVMERLIQELTLTTA